MSGHHVYISEGCEIVDGDCVFTLDFPAGHTFAGEHQEFADEFRDNISDPIIGQAAKIEAAGIDDHPYKGMDDPDEIKIVLKIGGVTEPGGPF